MNRTICAAIALGVLALSAVPSHAATVDLTPTNTATLEGNLPLGQNSGTLQTFNPLGNPFSDGWDFTSAATTIDFTITHGENVSDLTISLYSFTGDGPFPFPATLVAPVATGGELAVGGLTVGGFYFLDLQGIGTGTAASSVEGNISATPLPAALPLYAAGIGVMGLLGWRRKRKPQAMVTAAA